MCGKNWRWEGRINEIHEGGIPLGSSTAVFHLARTDVDPEDDLPAISGVPSGDNVRTRTWTVPAVGRRLFSVAGELWKTEWVNPGLHSPRVRRDRLAPTVFFITDASGTRENAATLVSSGCWLWFRAEVIPTLAHRRGGELAWYSRDTGSVSCSPGYSVHFGVNKLGLITVYAKDVALLPDWQQRLWAGFNVSPEGGVSEELLASQVAANPADTDAPEDYLEDGINLLNEITSRQLGFDLFRHHEQLAELRGRIHRFRASDTASLLSLAKDLARITADSIDSSSLQKHVPPPKGQKWGSLKSLENLLATRISPSSARSATGPLVGIYQLRHADAHLSSSNLGEAYELVGVNPRLPFVLQGLQLITACVSTLYVVAEILEQNPPEGVQPEV
jgi:hypothetical protein